MTVKDKIYAYMKTIKSSVTAEDMASRFLCSRNTTTTALSTLFREGKVTFVIVNRRRHFRIKD